MSERYLYWAFYKSTITLNFGFSLLFSLVISAAASGGYLPGEISAETYPEAACRYFAYAILFIGPTVTFLYKDLARPSEYYFYYNRGISKVKLFICCLLVNTLPATAALILKHYVAQA